MVYVGEALFLRCRNGKEIRHELCERNSHISLREIDHLGRRFIVYLALAHEQSQAQLKQFMGSRGGYKVSALGSSVSAWWTVAAIAAGSCRLEYEECAW